MSWVHSPQETPPSHLLARSHWAPQTCSFSGTEVWEIAQRTGPESTLLPAAAARGSGNC